MKRYEASRSPCPVGRASRILGDRWILLILREAFLGASRFEDFMTRLPISRAALTSRLTMLIDAELVKRDPPDSKRADYRLTQAALDLEPVYAAIGQWSTNHLFSDNDKPSGWRKPSYQS